MGNGQWGKMLEMTYRKCKGGEELTSKKGEEIVR
jgi:hypothetical protein